MTAKPPSERQADRRARMMLLGMTEVRGIFLPPELHPVIKRLALRLLEMDTAERAAEVLKAKT